MGKSWDKDMIQYIGSICQGKRWSEVIDEVEKKFNIRLSEFQIHGIAQRNNFSNGLQGKTRPEQKLLTEEEHNYLVSVHKGKYAAELVDLLFEFSGKKLTIRQIKSWRARNHLDSGLTGLFEKGHIPANKGQKMSPEVYQKSRATMFKSGNIPSNRAEIGTERRVKDGYIQVKMFDCRKNKNWVMKHHLVYEQTTGHKVMPGERVIFLDGDKYNFNPENLRLVTVQEHAVLNHNFTNMKNAELREVQLNTLRLKNKIKEVEDGQNK